MQLIINGDYINRLAYHTKYENVKDTTEMVAFMDNSTLTVLQNGFAMYDGYHPATSVGIHTENAYRSTHTGFSTVGADDDENVQIVALSMVEAMKEGEDKEYNATQMYILNIVNSGVIPLVMAVFDEDDVTSGIERTKNIVYQTILTQDIANDEGTLWGVSIVFNPSEYIAKYAKDPSTWEGDTSTVLMCGLDSETGRLVVTDHDACASMIEMNLKPPHEEEDTNTEIEEVENDDSEATTDSE